MGGHLQIHKLIPSIINIAYKAQFWGKSWKKISLNFVLSRINPIFWGWTRSSLRYCKSRIKTSLSFGQRRINRINRTIYSCYKRGSKTRRNNKQMQIPSQNFSHSIFVTKKHPLIKSYYSSHILRLSNESLKMKHCILKMFLKKIKNF